MFVEAVRLAEVSLFALAAVVSPFLAAALVVGLLNATGAPAPAEMLLFIFTALALSAVARSVKITRRKEARLRLS